MNKEQFYRWIQKGKGPSLRQKTERLIPLLESGEIKADDALIPALFRDAVEQELDAVVEALLRAWLSAGLDVHSSTAHDCLSECLLADMEKAYSLLLAAGVPVTAEHLRACAAGYSEDVAPLIRQLIAMGAPVQGVDIRDFFSTWDIDLVEEIWQGGAILPEPTETLFDEAACGRSLYLDFLVSHGADIHARNEQGYSVIEWLWENCEQGLHGYPQAEKKLLQLGAEPMK